MNVSTPSHYHQYVFSWSASMDELAWAKVDWRDLLHFACRYIIQIAYQTAAAIIRMVDAIHDGYMGKVKWWGALNAGHIHAKLLGVWPSLVEGINAAYRAKKMSCFTCVKPIFRQFVLAFNDMDAWKLGGNGHRTSHAAKWASTSPDGVEFIGKLHLEFNRATVALSMFFLRHSVTLVAVCEKLGGWNISRWDLKQCMLIRLVDSIKFAHRNVLSHWWKRV